MDIDTEINGLAHELWAIAQCQAAIEDVVTIMMAELHGFAKAVATAERESCVSICREVAERYPADIFPEDGQSLDCKSARMARLTAANIEREITDRSNP